MSKENSYNKSEVKVEILGEEYIIKGKESSEYIMSIANFVDEHMKEIQENITSISRNRVIILGAMNFADKLCQVQEKNESLKEDNHKLESSFKKILSENNKLKEKYRELKEEYEEFLELVEKGDFD
ncbi:cell division protein ZapA [Orenia marismortui]|uniref:Cell division protein ZapA n=1 Tax=Orenia marismortui TaxID=46469 RepID=A0A4R8GPY6_9FIRM|nr:cell division protein ZapA [Orenia marismortui]TDX46798.1 cell division protein ZapA [Orenia marismortui]